MKNFLIEFFRPLDNFLFNYFVKIGVIKPIIGALIGGALSARSASKARKESRRQAEQAREDISSAFEQIREPRDILLEAYGEEGLYGPEVTEAILGRERELMGPMLELQRDYAQQVAFGKGGLRDVAEQTTGRILSRMQRLGPQFRKAMEDPRIASLVNQQIAKFRETYSDLEATSAEREAAAKEFDAGLKSAFQQVGVSGEDGFLGDIRGLTDIERAEAERLTEAARGPLGFEALRRAEQAARAEGGALGRQLDASAVARAALGREEAVMAREDRAAAARARAAELAGFGSTQALNLARLQGAFGAQAREESLRAIQEGRAQFGTALQGARAASVDPSQIFFQEAQPAFNLYSSIIGQRPGTYFTDPGQMISLGSATDVQRANILGGQAAIAAQQAAGASQRSAGYLSTAGKLLGGMDFSQMRNPFAQSASPMGTVGQGTVLATPAQTAGSNLISGFQKLF
jgi:hypothetical protein